MQLKTLAIHIDKNTFLETQVRQLVQKTNQQQSKLDLRTLLDTIDNLKQKVALLESYDQRLGIIGFTWQPQLKVSKEGHADNSSQTFAFVKDNSQFLKYSFSFCCPIV